MNVSIDSRYIRERPSGIGEYVQALVAFEGDDQESVATKSGTATKMASPMTANTRSRSMADLRVLSASEQFL